MGRVHMVKTLFKTMTGICAHCSSCASELTVGTLKAGLARMHLGQNHTQLVQCKRILVLNWTILQDLLWHLLATCALCHAGHAAAFPAVSGQWSARPVEAEDLGAQKTEEKRLAWLEQQLADLGREEASQGVPRLTPGNLCAAQFSLDNQWYRARVAHVKGEPLFCFFSQVSLIR